MSNSVEIRSRQTFFCKFRQKVCNLTAFADFLSNFYVFLHFGRFLRFKNTILCKFADKIPKRRRFCQHRKICFSSRLQRTKRKSKRKPRTVIQSIRGFHTVSLFMLCRSEIYFLLSMDLYRCISAASAPESGSFAINALNMARCSSRTVGK